MKAIFGVLSLVIVLAIVGSIAKKQLQAVNAGAVARDAGAASGVDRGGLTVPQQARSMQEQARSNTVRALEEGAKRNQRAEP